MTARHSGAFTGPVAPVPAATLVLLRSAGDGMEVLLLRRNRTAGFVPGAYVFPGGRVDPSDIGPAALRRVDGLTPEAAAARLDLVGGNPPAIAYYLASLREAFEETGILVALDREGGAPPTAAEDPTVDRLREQLMQDRIDFGEVLRLLDLRVAGGAVEYLAHWITPESEPRRFDTRFFAAQVPGAAEPIVDSREMSEALWITPELAVREHGRDSLPMILPTVRTLEQLRGYSSPQETLAALAVLSVPTILPSLEAIPPELGGRST